MGVNTTEQTVTNKGYLFYLQEELGKNKPGYESALAIEKYVKGDRSQLQMRSLVETFQNTRIDPNTIDKGLEAAGVSARARQDILEALAKTKSRTRGRIAAKQPETAGQKALKGLLSPRTTFQGEPTDPEDLYTALSKAIKANQKSIQKSAMASEDLPTISRPS